MNSQEAVARSAAADAADPVSGTDTLRLFGSPRIGYAGQAADEALEWHKPVAFLAYLACRPGWHSRDALAEVFRPAASEQHGKAYVRGLLHRTREVFPRLRALHTRDGSVRWSGRSDIGAFEQAIAQGQWSRAIALQELPLLHEVGSTGAAALDDWFHEERLRLRQRLGAALIALIGQLQPREQGDRADLMQRLADHDPLDENAIQVLLAQARTPLERHIAAAAFHTLKRRLATEFGQKTLARTDELLALLQAGAGTAAPADPGAPRRAACAPGAPAPLGRERELAELAELLASRSARLVTIHGAGGVGKTSVARALHERTARGAAESAWVDLTAADTSHRMLDAIASQLGVPVREGPVEGQLAHWLAGRRMVLFLDNFEQLSAHAEVLERLLRAAPHVRCVVTSREALGLLDETLFPLAGLPCRGEHSAAAKLFELHAARMGHAIGCEERSHVASLVQYLEGLPLVIELAANWVNLLPVKAILQELRANPAFIDAAAAHPGNRSMRSVLQATWRRLDAREQEALASLSVVLGAIDLCAARAIACADAGVLLRLVRKSLLQRSEEGLFRLHPLLRNFASSQAAPRTLQQARARHAQHFLVSLAEQPPLRLGCFVRDQLERLLPQAQDIALAWGFAVDDGRSVLLARALPNLAGLFLVAARHEEIAELARHASSRLGPGFPEHGTLAAVRALALFMLGKVEQAEGVAVARLEREPAHGTARAMLGCVLSRVRRFYGNHAQALSDARHALESLRESDSAFARMQVLQDLALCHWHLGQLAEAESCLLRNLTLASRHDARYAEATSLCLLGILRDAAGSSEEGLELLQSSERLFREMGDRYQVAYCQRGMSYVYLKLGDLARQAGMAQAALDAFAAAGYHHEIGESLFAVVVAHDAAGRTPQARETCLDALRRCVQAGQVPIALRCIGALGAFEAPASRQWGIALLAFVADHPALRRADTAFVDRRLARLGATPAELAAARERAAGWTFQWVCHQLLGSAGAPDEVASPR